MTNQHPVTPSPELIKQWQTEGRSYDVPGFAIKAARWGADQELEACVEHLKNNSWAPNSGIKLLRAARRPKPPSLKEQALTAMLHLQKAAETNMDTIEAVHIICRALEALPND
jgi:hypothetical protein